MPPIPPVFRNGRRGCGRVLVPLVVSREAQKEMPANLAALKQHLEGIA